MQLFGRNGFTDTQVLDRLQSENFTYEFEFWHLDSTNKKLRVLDNIVKGSWSLSYVFDRDTKMTGRGVLENPTGFSINFYTDRIQPWIWISMPGAGDDGSSYAKYPQGIYRFGEDTEETDSVGTKFHSVNIYDLTSLLVFPIIERLSYGKGALLTTAVNDLLTAVGLTDSYIIGSSLKFPANVDWPKGTRRSDIMAELLDQLSYEMYASPTGQIIVAPWRDPALVAPGFTFTEGAQGLQFIPARKNTKSFNRVNFVELTSTVPGQEVPLVGRASNTNINDPGSIDSRGVTIALFENVEAETQDQIDAMALRRLIEVGTETNAGELETPLFPALDAASNIIKSAHSKIGFSGNYFVRQWDAELKYDGRTKLLIDPVVSID